MDVGPEAGPLPLGEEPDGPQGVLVLAEELRVGPARPGDVGQPRHRGLHLGVVHPALLPVPLRILRQGGPAPNPHPSQRLDREGLPAAGKDQAAVRGGLEPALAQQRPQPAADLREGDQERVHAAAHPGEVEGPLPLRPDGEVPLEPPGVARGVEQAEAHGGPLARRPGGQDRVPDALVGEPGLHQRPGSVLGDGQRPEGASGVAEGEGGQGPLGAHPRLHVPDPQERGQPGELRPLADRPARHQPHAPDRPDGHPAVEEGGRHVHCPRLRRERQGGDGLGQRAEPLHVHPVVMGLLQDHAAQPVGDEQLPLHARPGHPHGEARLLVHQAHVELHGLVLATPQHGPARPSHLLDHPHRVVGAVAERQLPLAIHPRVPPHHEEAVLPQRPLGHKVLHAGLVGAPHAAPARQRLVQDGPDTPGPQRRLGRRLAEVEHLNHPGVPLAGVDAALHPETPLVPLPAVERHQQPVPPHLNLHAPLHRVGAAGRAEPVEQLHVLVAGRPTPHHVGHPRTQVVTPQPVLARGLAWLLAHHAAFLPVATNATL
eukprot:765856-Hanusia_phi.AAC.6